MTWNRSWCLTCSLVILLVISGTARGFDLDSLPEDPAEKARIIMDYVDDLWRGTSSRAEMSMSVRTAHWERTLKMDSWAMGKAYSLVRITSPKKEAGTTTLKYEKDIYNYLPKTDRTIKITSGMMMNAWMGSHFTNDDLVKESRLSQDYLLEIAFEGDRAGVNVWEVKLVPKPDAAVVWGKILFTIRQGDFMPVQAQYFDEEGGLVRTMLFSDYREMNGRLLPAKMKIVPEDNPGEFTELIYHRIEFNIKLGKGFFSLSNLKRKHG